MLARRLMTRSLPFASIVFDKLLLSIASSIDLLRMKFRPTFSLVALFGASTLLAATVTTQPSPDVDRAALLQGVSEIGAPGAPGGVCAFGPQAFAVVAGKDGKKALLPVVAGTRWEKGRIVAFGHNGYLTATDSGSIQL